MLVLCFLSVIGPPSISFEDQGQRVEVTLTQSKRAQETALTVAATTRWNDEVYVSERTERYQQEFAPTVDFFLPIQVAGSKRPQIVAQVQRANWTDLLVFSVSNYDVKKAFSFSSRGGDAVLWKANKDGVKELVTYDKYEPVPNGLKQKEKGSSWWMLVTHWVWQEKSDAWKPKSKLWKSYEFGTVLPGTSEPPSQVEWLP